MKRARGPRPWAIRLFAIAFTVQGLAAFAHAITHLAQTQAMLVATTSLPLGRDLTIVIVSARLTIALIPVMLVWCIAAGFARWLVLALAIGKVVMLPANLPGLGHGDTLAPLWVAEQVLTLVSAALLFTPAAARWFRHRGEPLARTFD